MQERMQDQLAAAIARSWGLPLWPTVAILLTGVIYFRGWRRARRTRPAELPAWRMCCFMGGLLVLWLALASPIDALGQFLLLAHMTQHLVLMSVAPPLLVLGAPTVPMLRGLSHRFVRDDLSLWMNSKRFAKLRKFIMHPMTGWVSMNAAFLGWHVPAAYELALRSNGWHDVEHGCFLLPSILFWWFVLEPWPSHTTWSRWTVLPYLVGADLVNTALSAFLAFSGRVVYLTYAEVPRLFSISALDDQVAAGAEMWVLGSLIFLVPAMVITWRLLATGNGRQIVSPELVGHQRLQAIAGHEQAFDLLKVPLIGDVLKSRYGRIGLQAASFVLMAMVIADGLRGTSLSSMNLAGLFSWNVIRPIGLIALLCAGNLFCMACPFTLPRELARAAGIARFRWPRWLNRKWIAAALMVLFFWGYEQFALWDSPRATAMVLIAYTATALIVDSIFRGGNFCKYVCPIGQFNFVASIVSPLELGIRKAKTCASCTTHDCIRGNEKQRGCELQLYLPNKIGNLDCTLCMDCVKACPHDNVSITIQSPIREFERDLVQDPMRSSIGRLSSRVDIAVLALVVCFSSVINSALMIAPVVEFVGRMEEQNAWLGTKSGALIFAGLIGILLLLIWLVLAQAVQALSNEHKVRRVFCRLSLAALPLGLAMWAAHLSFHLVTSANSVLPMLQHAAADLGPRVHRSAIEMSQAMLGMSDSVMPVDLILMPGSKGLNLLSLQIAMLDVGILMSLYAGWKIVLQMATSFKSRLAMTAIWIGVMGTFYSICVWVFMQPMQMRGMGMQ